jgi:hypothetical protein
LEMLNNVDLVEEDERVQNAEGRIVEDARKNDVFEVLEPVRVMYLPFDVFVFYPDNLLKLGFVSEVLSMVGFV